ncbi:MAG TPA: O-antigen ligase family protein [Mycobacteriales bacterium]|nr:O-antigen ligase family protein [Mycobacteriales bacterium]
MIRRFAHPRALHAPAMIALGLLVIVAVELRAAGHAKLVSEAILGVLLVTVISRRPAAWISVLIVLVPLQFVIFGLLYRLHVPTAALRAGGALKDAIVAGVVVAAMRESRSHRRKPDRLDVFAFAFLLIATIYLLVPIGFISQGLSNRSLAWRFDCEPVIALIACRRLDLGDRGRRLVERSLLVTAAIVIGFGLLEFINKDEFYRVIVHVFYVRVYAAAVLHSFNLLIVDQNTVAGTTVVRVGSVLFSPLSLAFWILLPSYVALRRAADRVRDPLVLIVAIGGPVTLVLTQTRSAIAAGIIGALFMLGRSGGPARARRRLAFGLLASTLLLVPVAAATTLSVRVDNGFSASDVSTQGHIDRTTQAWHILLDHPFGLGLGTNPEVLGSGHTNFVSEDFYLQVGNETGLFAMLAYTGALGLLALALWRRARDGTPEASGPFAAGIALMLIGLVLHSLQVPAVALTFFAIAGLGLAAPGPQTRTDALDEADASVDAPAGPVVHR